jgi:hypothetical protein
LRKIKAASTLRAPDTARLQLAPVKLRPARRVRVMAVSRQIIAVVDDDAAVRASLKFSLEIDGFAVCTYASADELLNADGVVACQCLVVDQDMPDKTGLELEWSRDCGFVSPRGGGRHSGH